EDEALPFPGGLADAVAETLVGVPSDDPRHERERFREGARDAARDRALLDHHPVGERRTLAHVDDAGDARADGLPPRVPPADAVDLLIAVVAEGEDVAVAG